MEYGGFIALSLALAFGQRPCIRNGLAVAPVQRVSIITAGYGYMYSVDSWPSSYQTTILPNILLLPPSYVHGKG